MSYYEPNVLYCSYEMNIVIHQLQDNPNFFEEYNDEIDPILCNILMHDFVWNEKK